MKKIISALVFFVTVFSFVNNSYSQSGWQWQNPTPVLGSETYSVYFINDNTGWKSARGKIYMTTNFGENWALQYENNGIGPIFSLQFINNTTGYAVTFGKLLSTTNSGSTWQSADVIVTSNYFSSVFFKNTSTGFITSVQGYVYRTTNGGGNWSTQQFHTGALPISIKFFNENDGLMFTSPYFFGSSTSQGSKYYKTTNGGINWSAPINSPNYFGRNVYFTNAATGWICTKDTIFKTTNGGTNWNKAPAIGNTLSMHFLNSETGYACADSGRINKTTDGGLNWHLQNTGFENNLNCVFALSENKCAAVGTFGSVVKTSDGGSNWSYTPYSVYSGWITNIKAASPEMIYAGGYRKFLRSFNSGVNWEVYDIPLYDIYSMSFVNAVVGFVSGYGGGIYKTVNGGVTWEDKSIQWGGYMTSIHFMNEQTGFVIGGPYIYKTTNSGLNWVINLEAPLGYNYSELSFTDGNTGYAAGLGIISKTTNSGVNWVLQQEFYLDVETLHFTNSQTGWFSTSNSLRKSTNGGVTWDSISNISQIRQMYFANALTGWCVNGNTESGGIYHTNDGGYNWQAQYVIGEYNTFYGLSFLNATTGWVCGPNGIILKTTTGGNVFISQTSSEVPEKYSLQQNYPNPFNPSTNIKFDIHKSGIASLKVFNIQGKQVETLVDEQLGIGSYEVTFNASSLSSGIYFYILKTGDFVESKRMVLVK